MKVTFEMKLDNHVLLAVPKGVDAGIGTQVRMLDVIDSPSGCGECAWGDFLCRPTAEDNGISGRCVGNRVMFACRLRDATVEIED